MSRLEEDQRTGHCRQCGERLPLIKRVKREEFCSDEHRERYLSSTQTVALNRLREADAPMERTAVAVEEEPAPPMAGTIGPSAVDSPMLLAAWFDDDATLLGQWEPVKPEPQWHNLALRFGLASFSGDAPGDGAALSQGPLAIHDENGPEDLALALNLPRNGISVVSSQEPGAEEPAENAAPDAAYAIPALLEAISLPRRAVSPHPEIIELDAMLLLPAFTSPESLAATIEEWVLAGSSGVGPEARGETLGLAIQPGEPEAIFEQALFVTPPASGCAPVRDELAVEEESFEELADRLSEEAAPVLGGGEREWEEKGMSETVQNMAEGSGVQALGARIANPFLYEPQPRPGSGKPRWSPVTVSLGAAPDGSTPERSMEDWDIL